MAYVWICIEEKQAYNEVVPQPGSESKDDEMGVVVPPTVILEV